MASAESPAGPGPSAGSLTGLNPPKSCANPENLMGKNAWYHAGWPPLISLLGILIWFWPMVLGSRPWGGEISATHLPQMAAYGQSLKAGRLPVWNDRDGFGAPLLAEGQIGVLYPPHLVLFRLLDADNAYTASMLIHFWLAAWFAYLCARGFQLRQGASALAALVYAGQGFFIVHLSQPWSYAGGCWLPLAVLAGRRWTQDGRWRWLFGLALILWMQLLAGHFQIAFYTLIVVLLLGLNALVRGAGGWVVAALRTLALTASIGLAFTGAAAQLLPTAELIAAGDGRGRGADYVASFATPPAGLLNYLVPTLLQHPFWEAAVWIPNRSLPHESLPYVGLLSVGLAGWAVVVGRREERVQLWAGLVLASLLLSLGPAIPGFRVLTSLPGWAWFSAPARWSLIGGLFLGLLAGRGLEGLRLELFPRWCWGYAVVVFCALVVSVGVGAAALQTVDHPISGAYYELKLFALGYEPSNVAQVTPAGEFTAILQRELILPTVHLLGLLLLGLTGAVVNSPRRLAGLALIWTALDLGVTNQLLSPVKLRSRASSATQTPVLEVCSQRAADRIAGTVGRRAMLVGANALSTDGSPDMAAYWHPERRDVAFLFPESVPTVPPAARFADTGVRLARDAWLMTPDDIELFRLANVRTLCVAHGTGDVELRQQAERQSMFPDPQSGPLRLVGRYDDRELSTQVFGPGIFKVGLAGTLWSVWELPPNLNSSRAWAFPVADPVEPGTDPRLFRMPPPARRRMLESAQPARHVADFGDAVTVQGQTKTASVLVLSDLHYPGWQAELRRGDRIESLPIEPAFGQWRAVYLPEAGDYEVTFRYRPRSLHVGLRISAAAAAVWLATALLVWIWRWPTDRQNSN